ncbi:MAG: 4-(cytidine 5'-diphospho)-2-C-methyl-D-erythritol kinase, partial [Chloroflexota bacterium]
VGPRGADGFHPLRSVFLRVGLTDELVVAPSPGPGGDVLTVKGNPDCPVEGNLVLRAFALLRQAIGHDLPPLVAHLDKRIPMGGGLGGGSSDAAATVMSALTVWGVGLAPDVLAEIEEELGADVPFFARGGDVALVTGRGENIERLPAPTGDLGIVLVTPPFAISTARVYDRFDELGAPAAASNASDDLASELRTGMSGTELAAWAARLRDANDLWPAAASVEPRLTGVRAELERTAGDSWLLSGSGSTLFALFTTPAAAVEAGRRLVSAESDVLGGAIINAVDVTGPEPIWRYP